MTTGREPWARNEKETGVAFEAFVTYRDMGAGRSLAKVGVALGKSTTLIERWSSVWEWVERTASWDDFLDEQKRGTQVETVREINARHSVVARGMISRVVDRLNALTDVKEMTVGQMIEAFKVGVAVERQSMGQPGEIIEHQDGSGDEYAFFEELTDNPTARDLFIGLAEELQRQDLLARGVDASRNGTKVLPPSSPSGAE